MITSANKVSMALGEALLNNGIAVKVVDSRLQGLKEARMLGMEVFFGSPLSEHADRYMDLTGYTHLLAMSRNTEANTIVCNRFRHFFGPRNIFSARIGGESGDRNQLAQGLKSRGLFSDDATWAKLASLLGQGAVIKATSLTEEYNFETHCMKWGSNSIPLFALDDKGKLKVFSDKNEFEVGNDWTLINLVLENGGKPN